VCQRRIERYEEANALTRQLTQHTEDENPIFVHWECDEAVHDEYRNHEPLIVFLRNLCLNGEYEQGAAERMRRRFAFEFKGEDDNANVGQ